MGTSQGSMNPTNRPASSNTPPSASRLDNESSEEIGGDIEDTRSRMDETLDELGERLSPRRILDDVVDYFTGPSGGSGAKSSSASHTAAQLRDSAGEFGQNLGRTIRDNPVPTALIGAGLAWLAFGLGGSDSEEQDHPRRRRRRHGRDRYFSGYDDDDAFMTDDDSSMESRYQKGLIDQGHYEDDGRGAFRNDSYMDRTDNTDDPSLWDQTKQAASGVVGSVGEAASSAGSAIAGAASTAGDAIGDAASATASGVSSAVSSVAGGASSAAEATSDAASAAYRRTRQAGSDAYHYGAQSGRSVGRGFSRQSQNLSDSVSELTSQAAEKYQQAIQQYPLAVGAGCLALGMLAGLVVPRTRREDQWMGDASDELKDDAWKAGEQLVERGQHIVAETMDTAKESADEHGLTGEGVLERGKKVVSKVAEAASEALEEEDLTTHKLASDVKSVGHDVGEKVAKQAEKITEDVKAQAAKVDSDVTKL